MDFSNLDKHPPLSYYLHSIKLNICMHKSNFCVFPFLRITYFLIPSFIFLSGKCCSCAMQYEFKKFQVIWQCLSFGNVSAIGKPPHQSRGCYLESTKADWQYEYDFKRLSSILAIFVLRSNFGNICSWTKLCNISAIGDWLATATEAVFCKAMQAWQYEFDFSRHFEHFGNVCLLA